MKLSAIWILAMVIGQPQSNNIHHLRSGMRTRNRDMNHEILVGQKQDPDCSWLMKKTNYMGLIRYRVESMYGISSYTFIIEIK